MYHLLWFYSPVGVGPGPELRIQVFSRRISFYTSLSLQAIPEDTDMIPANADRAPEVSTMFHYVNSSVSTKVFIVDRNKSYVLHNYQKFSMESYVVAIY